MTEMYQMDLLAEGWIEAALPPGGSSGPPEAPPNEHSVGITISHADAALRPVSITCLPSAPPTANLLLPPEPSAYRK